MDVFMSHNKVNSLLKIQKEPLCMLHNGNDLRVDDFGCTVLVS